MKRLRSRPPRRDQSGEGWVGTLLWALVAVVVLVVGVKMLKPKYHQYVLENKLDEIVRFQGAHSEQAFKKDILEMAQRENLPIAEENIEVNRTSALIQVKVTMDQEVDLIVAKYTVHTVVEKQSNSY